MYQLLAERKYYYAVISGFCAAWGSLCGKLSGNFSAELSFDNVGQLFLKAVFICMMLVSNAAVWTFYVKALQASSTTIIPTIISTSSNYIVTAIGGFIVFNERISFLWCFGMFFIIVGVAMIVHSDSNATNNETSDKKDS